MNLHSFNDVCKLRSLFAAVCFCGLSLVVPLRHAEEPLNFLIVASWAHKFLPSVALGKRLLLVTLPRAILLLWLFMAARPIQGDIATSFRQQPR